MIDEVLLGQLNTVVRQSAHRVPSESLLEHYGLLAKIRRQLARHDDDVRIGPSTRAALEALELKLGAGADNSCGPDYPGPWYGIIHGDLHGGNIMVDSRSYAWLIDYGEVEDAHVFKDPAKLEACIWFIYTTLPVPHGVVLNATAHELKWWLTIPIEVAVELIAAAEAQPDACTEAVRRSPPRSTACDPPHDGATRCRRGFPA